MRKNKLWIGLAAVAFAGFCLWWMGCPTREVNGSGQSEREAGVTASGGARAAESHGEQSGDDGRHRGVEQHFDRGVRAALASRRETAEGSGFDSVPAAAAAGADDVAGDAAGADSDGA